MALPRPDLSRFHLPAFLQRSGSGSTSGATSGPAYTNRGPSRGVVFPSRVVMLSVLAVVLAAAAFFLPHHSSPTEKQVAAPTAQQQPTSSATKKTTQKKNSGSSSGAKKTPVVQRGKVYVEVFNNSGITGLAARVGTQTTAAGWKVVGTDNWYGSIPTNTVYFPPRLKTAGQQLALDLGIHRTAPSVGAMKSDRLTVILTGELSH